MVVLDPLSIRCPCNAGSVVFVPAGTTPTFTSSAGGPLKVWGAACNRNLFVREQPAVEAEVVVAAPVPELVAA